jgi:hypothetical protein
MDILRSNIYIYIYIYIYKIGLVLVPNVFFLLLILLYILKYVMLYNLKHPGLISPLASCKEYLLTVVLDRVFK